MGASLERRIAHTFAGAWLLASVLAGAACGSPTGAERPGVSLADLAGAEWTLVELDGAALPPGADAPTASFEAGAVAGFSGCNRYRGPVREVSPGVVEIGVVAGTMMMCEPPAMGLEGRFLAALGDVKRYTLAGDRIALHTSEASPPLLVFARRGPPGPAGG